jgi:hypothetical protein
MARTAMTPIAGAPSAFSSLDYRGGDYDLPLGPVILRWGNVLKLSNFCPKCGKVLCVCFSLAVGGVSIIEAHSPPETECSAACTERPLATKPWSPDAPDHDYDTTNQRTIEQAAETGAVAPVPWGWEEEANRLPPAYRYPRRRAASNQFDDGVSWIVPLMTAAPLPPGGGKDVNNLPPASRYLRRHAAISQPDESAWMGPLVLRSTSTSDTHNGAL